MGIVLTLCVTLWRKRFGESVKIFQSGSVEVQASLSLLNIMQQIPSQGCIATALIISTLEIGDFITVLTYTMNLFIPLNFLGSVYNAIVMAVVDLTNLSELLAEDPDVKDNVDALQLPRENEADPSNVVEFDKVFFHYPSQTEDSGIKGLSFLMKKGTVTALVGSTGSGKTTCSRLLFRFYDVLGGALKVNGLDIRTVTQKSLRDMIGVVPQNTTLFNDTVKNNIL